MNNHGILEMYQTYFVGRRPQLVSSILKEAKQAGHLIAAPKEFPTNAETLDKALTKMIKNIAELQKQMSQGKALKQFYLEHDIGPVPETSTGVSPWSRLAEDSAAPTGNGGPKGRSPKSLLIKDDAYPYGEHADEGGKWGAFYKGK